MAPGSLTGPFGKSGVRAPTAEQAARFDRGAIAERGVPEPALMENAGRQAALIVEHLMPGGRVVGLVGSGNNGGDALVCLRALAAWGRAVTAVVVGRRPSADPVLHGWALPRVDFDPARPGATEGLARILEGAQVVVDGLLGTGIRGEPRAGHAAAIRAANRASAAVVSLDAPSGVDGTGGRAPGAAVRADVTVAFGWPKLGTLLYPGRELSGRIVAVEIGFPPDGTEDWARPITPGWASKELPRRPVATHKNDVGALAVVAGSAMPGAAILAARSAFRCGAGLVRTCSSGPVREVVAEVPETVFVDAGDEQALSAAVERSRAVAVGPGMGTGDAARRQLEVAMEARGSRPAVVDADALTLLAAGACAEFDDSGEAGIVVTPHPGEMARLAACSVAEVQDDRVGTARRFAASRGVVTLLKGAPSLVAEPGGGLMVSLHENPSELAVAGMGDVLTGAVGSFLAQGVEPFRAAGLALHTTGRAASRAGLGAALTPSDAVEAIPSALAERGEGTTDLPFPFVTFDQPPPG
ncbi:MAG: NAD(P)H-hydrate dehydratase [Gemmatimonadota bacterium]|nr:NAD(P)H-hydrate dehydratase [Gemmatimonadota bacterium]